MVGCSAEKLVEMAAMSVDWWVLTSADKMAEMRANRSIVIISINDGT